MLVITTQDGRIKIEHFNNFREMREAAEKEMEGIEAAQKGPSIEGRREAANGY